MHTYVDVDLLKETIREVIKELLQDLKGLNSKPKPLSIAEVADRYGVSKATIHNWMKNGVVTGFKQGKGRFFYLDELEKNLTKFRYLNEPVSKTPFAKSSHVV